MDLERYYELRAILQQWRMRLAESIRRRIEDSARWLARLHNMYEGEGAGEDFATWLDRWCRQAAIQFILRVLFLRVLEDRELLGAVRIRSTDGQRMWAELTRNLGAAHYAQWCCWDAAHLLPDLFGPTDYDLVPPDDDLAQRFLDDVWRRPDPNRPGWIRFDFRPDPARADEGFQTRFIGDLYQELDAEIREHYAMLQTPHFISQFILEHTLLERFKEKDFREVTLIDPTCGSGHFLVDAFWMFVEQYETVAGGRPPAVSARAEIARTIIETHLFGCDINPYATALARFRLTLAACDYARPTSLRDFRDLRFSLVTIDSLIPYEKLMMAGGQVGSGTATALGQSEAIQRALPVLRGRYDVVVGNPPYILAYDANKREIYRKHYISASGKFNLSAPFTERFIALAADGGCIGLIESNAFAQRLFGRELIERVLPKYHLDAVVDLGGAYVPGHGTPTLMLFVKNSEPTVSKAKVVACRRSETSTPAIPSEGKVWRSIAEHYNQKDFDNEYIEITEYTRQELNHHPWNLSPNRRLMDKIRQCKTAELSELAFYLGPGCLTGADDVYLMTEDQARREKIQSTFIKRALRGEDVRDWTLTPNTVMLVPYRRGEEGLETFDLDTSGAALYLQQFHPMLAERSPLPAGRTWFELCRSAGAEGLGSYSLAIAYLATHNHFALNGGNFVYQRSGYSFRATEEIPDDIYFFLSSLLNTALVCFYLKEICFNKGAGNDPVRDRYDYAGQQVGTVPVSRDYLEATPNRRRMLALAEEMLGLADQLPTLAMQKLFEQAGEAYHTWNAALDGYVAPYPDLPPPFTSASELRAARDKLIALRRDIRGRMIFLQEEMDWLAYEMYGLIRKAPLAEDYLSPFEYRAARLELGQRPFEVAGEGYKGDWPKGYKPAPLPENLRPLTEARIVIIESNSDVALLEDPLYKRRWVPPDYDQEFRSAAERWLAEKLEWALEQHGLPISLREWARLLGRDERVNAALEALTGSPAFDLEGELLAIIRANAVPDRPEHYLKASGLRKFYAVRNTQHVPQFSRKDFADGTAWKLRGKLNIPRERFIAYTQFDHTLRGVEVPETGGPWFGWAGWDSARRADALAFLLDRANRAGWTTHWQQCGLRASLRDLLPDLGELPLAERAEFEAIAGMCGIGLGTACYCQAYRDGVARGEPGVPGVGEEALGVKVLPVEGKRPGRGKRKAAGDEAEQLRLGLKD
jgi:hypothetical protein